MGYETRLYVIEEYNFVENEKYRGGSNLAEIDLCKIADCNLSGALDSATGKPFRLWAFNPDRQHEAVEVLRQVATSEDCLMSADEAKKLSDDIEDGYVTKDRYGSELKGIPIDRAVEALEEDVLVDEYRRFRWALALLREIRDSYPENMRDRLKVIAYGH